MKHSTLCKRALRQLAILACTTDTNHTHVPEGEAKTSFGLHHSNIRYREGKRKATRQVKLYGDGTRLGASVVWSADSVLIKARG